MERESGTESTEEQSLYQKKIKDFYHHLRKDSPGEREEQLGSFSLVTKTIDLMKISRESCVIYDFYKAEEMVEIGRQVAISSIEAYNKSKQ